MDFIDISDLKGKIKDFINNYSAFNLLEKRHLS